MAKNLATIQRQIEKLQKEAETIKSKEIAGVVERIRTEIQFYGLTTADLFGPAVAKTPKTSKTPKAPLKASKATKSTKAVTAKAAPIIRFQDDAGNTWTGHGKRPQWFKDALEAGKTANDLRVAA